ARCRAKSCATLTTRRTTAASARKTAQRAAVYSDSEKGPGFEPGPFLSETSSFPARGGSQDGGTNTLAPHAGALARRRAGVRGLAGERRGAAPMADIDDEALGKLVLRFVVGVAESQGSHFLRSGLKEPLLRHVGILHAEPDVLEARGFRLAAR